MHLTKEQREALDDRNNRIRRDYSKNISRKMLAKKYKLCRESIYVITKETSPKRYDPEERILTEGEQRIRDKYRSFDLSSEIGKAISLRWWDLGLTVNPKKRYQYD